MEFTSQVILGIGALLLVSVLASRISDRFGAPLLLLFLVIGMLLGEDGLGGIQFDATGVAFLIASLALAVILFDGGLRTPYSLFRLGLRPAAVLATFGVLVTAAITGVAAMLLFDVSLLGGLLIGAIVGSTDAAAVFYLLQASGLRINERVRATLEIESGSNDPMAVFLVVTIIGLAQGQGGADPASLIGSFAWVMGIGGAVGAAGGFALAALVNRVSLTESLYPLMVLAAGLAIFGLAGALGGSGYLAAYVGGIIAGNRMRRARHEIRRFHDGMAWLSQAGLFLILGLLVTPSQLLPLAPAALALALVLILVARPVAVALSLTPFRFHAREQAFIAWVGLRGAVPIVLGLLPLLADTTSSRITFNIAFFVVLVSLLIQGWTAPVAARRFRVTLPRRASGRRLMELDAPGLRGRQLLVYQVLREARAAGMLGRDVPLPPKTRMIAIVRGDRLLPSVEDCGVAGGDLVYLLADAEASEDLEALFGQAPMWEPEGQAFYGPFTLRGGARAGDVAAFYDVEIGETPAEQTLDEYLRARFRRQAAVGDRARLGDLELTVRAVEDDHITRVGLYPVGREARPRDR